MDRVSKTAEERGTLDGGSGNRAVMSDLVQACSLTLGREEDMLAEAVSRAELLPRETLMVFPEYLALHPNTSERAIEVLTAVARRRRQAYVTSLCLPGTQVPEGDRAARYNAAVIISGDGVQVVGAKISPQSFEMEQHEPSSPEIGVSPYPCFWRVPVRAGPWRFTVVVAVCSDLLYLATGTAGLHCEVADMLWVPANFGRGAEAGARAIGQLAVSARWFHEVILVNPTQKPRPGRKPLTRGMEDRLVEVPEAVAGGESGTRSAFDAIWEERMRIVRDHLVLVPDQAVSSFVAMAEWTDIPNGRIMMPASRASTVPPIRDWPGEPVVAF